MLFQVFNQEAVIQDFTINDAVVVDIHRRALPFYWFERREERDSSLKDAIPISMHTVLEGCMLITEHEVFECRPRYGNFCLFFIVATK